MYPGDLQCPILTSYSTLTLASADSLHPSASALSVASLAELTSGKSASRATSPKYTECREADKPFAKISENRLAKTIGMAVSSVNSSIRLDCEVHF